MYSLFFNNIQPQKNRKSNNSLGNICTIFKHMLFDSNTYVYGSNVVDMFPRSQIFLDYNTLHMSVA